MAYSYYKCDRDLIMSYNNDIAFKANTIYKGNKRKTGNLMLIDEQKEKHLVTCDIDVDWLRHFQKATKQDYLKIKEQNNGN